MSPPSSPLIPSVLRSVKDRRERTGEDSGGMSKELDHKPSIVSRSSGYRFHVPAFPTPRTCFPPLHYASRSAHRYAQRIVMMIGMEKK